MKTCDKCPKVSTCRKTCPEIEKQLRDSGVYSADWIRPQLPRSIVKKLKKQGVDKNIKWREIPFSSLPSSDRSKDPLMEDFRDL
jgi:hypothetical protein